MWQDIFIWMREIFCDISCLSHNSWKFPEAVFHSFPELKILNFFPKYSVLRYCLDAKVYRLHVYVWIWLIMFVSGYIWNNGYSLPSSIELPVFISHEKFNLHKIILQSVYYCKSTKFGVLLNLADLALGQKLNRII